MHSLGVLEQLSKILKTTGVRLMLGVGATGLAVRGRCSAQAHSFCIPRQGAAVYREIAIVYHDCILV